MPRDYNPRLTASDRRGSLYPLFSFVGRFRCANTASTQKPRHKRGFCVSALSLRSRPRAVSAVAPPSPHPRRHGLSRSPILPPPARWSHFSGNPGHFPLPRAYLATVGNVDFREIMLAYTHGRTYMYGHEAHHIDTKAEQTVAASSIKAAMLTATGHEVSRPFYAARGIRMYAVAGQKFGIALA